MEVNKELKYNGSSLYIILPRLLAEHLGVNQNDPAIVIIDFIDGDGKKAIKIKKRVTEKDDQPVYDSEETQ